MPSPLKGCDAEGALFLPLPKVYRQNTGVWASSKDSLVDFLPLLLKGGFRHPLGLVRFKFQAIAFDKVAGVDAPFLRRNADDDFGTVELKPDKLNVAEIQS